MTAATLELIDTKQFETMQAIDLKPSMAVELWENGILSPTAYVAIALKFEDTTKPLYIESFIHRWRGVLDPDSGKAKELTTRQVKMALLALEAKGLIEPDDKPVQISLNF